MLTSNIVMLIISISLNLPASGRRDVHITVNDSSTALKIIRPDTFTVYRMFPVLPKSMPYDEFKYLPIKITNEDKLWSLALPGYIHFETYDSRDGFLIAAFRLIGYGMMGYALYSGVPGSITDIRLSKVRTNLLVLGVGLGMNFAGWVYDIVHGEYRLREKQLRILYKYRRLFEEKGLGDDTGNTSE